METTKILLLVTLVTIASGYPGGAPSSTCGSMHPKHNDRSAQTRPPPFQIIVGVTNYKPGTYVDVVLKSNRNEYFKGFLVEARRAGNPTGHHALGSYISPKGPETRDCFGQTASAVTQSRNRKSTEVKLRWRPPSGNVGPVVFVATIVKTEHVFWEQVLSATLVFHTEATTEAPTSQRPTPSPADPPSPDDPVAPPSPDDPVAPPSPNDPVAPPSPDDPPSDPQPGDDGEGEDPDDETTEEEEGAEEEEEESVSSEGPDSSVSSSDEDGGNDGDGETGGNGGQLTATDNEDENDANDDQEDGEDEEDENEDEASDDEEEEEEDGETEDEDGETEESSDHEGNGQNNAPPADQEVGDENPDNENDQDSSSSDSDSSESDSS